MQYNTRTRKSTTAGLDPALRLPKDYPWKVLGWLTEDLRQFLDDRDFERISSIVRFRDIEALLSLSEEWGLQRMIPTFTSLSENSAKYQLASLLKKFRFATDRQARLLAAKESFLAGEEACSWFNREGYNQLVGAPESWMVNVFTYARSFMQKLLGLDVPGLDVMTFRSRHGPGATLDTTAGLVSSYFKYEKWPYQCTSAALRYARYAITHDERWLGALEDDLRTMFGIPKHRILDRQRFWDSVLEVVNGNRVAFVPKNARTERSIAIEPTMNLYLQLGVDGFIRRRLKRWGVDLDSQEKNQELSRVGSLGGIDPFITIDLANASNTISLKICELLLPTSWYSFLISLRSPQGALENDVISYEMISSMGNGYTFALESALFTSIIYGVMRETCGSFSRDEFAVFGDDIIVRQSLSTRLIEALTRCGFKINLEKSCLSGPTRESCGTDWFHGSPVRPVFLSEVPTDVAELFNDINRLKRILKLRWYLGESLTVSQMEKWIPEKFLSFIGPLSDQVFDAYRHSDSPKGRYRNCLWTYKSLVRRPMKMKGRKFHFRKLMHDLRGRQIAPNKWEKDLSGSGSRFNVYRRNALTLSVSHSVASHWQSEYTDYGPA